MRLVLFLLILFGTAPALAQQADPAALRAQVALLLEQVEANIAARDQELVAMLEAIDTEEDTTRAQRLRVAADRLTDTLDQMEAMQAQLAGQLMRLDAILVEMATDAVVPVQDAEPVE